MVQPPGIGGMAGMPRELIDLALMEAVVRGIERISRSVDQLAKSARNAGDDIRDEIDESTDVASERTSVALREVDRLFDTYKDQIKEAESEYRRFFDFIKRQSQATGMVGAAGGMLGMTGPQGIGAGLRNLKSQLFQGMPFGIGGLIGLMLWGAKREEEFAAAARRVVFQLQAVGETGREQVGLVTAQVRQMYHLWESMGEELEATLAGFAQFSVGAEAFEAASVSAGKLHKNIASVATAVDLLNAAQPGTTARLIGETMMNTGVSAREASDQVFALAGALREAKLNYSLFGAGIVQATSALRIQNQSLEDTAKLFMGLQKRFEMQGMSRQRAAQMAMTGVQAATQAIGGLPQGLQGVIAQRLAAQGAEGFSGMKDPFALMVKMQEGLSKGGPFASMVFGELRKVAEKAAGTSGTSDERRLRQIGTLQALGIPSFEAARAIIDGKDATEQLLTTEKRMAKFQEDLLTSFNTYSNRQSVFERDMRILQDSLAQIGGDILTLLTTSSVLLIENVAALPLRFKKILPGWMGGGELSRPERAKLQALDRFALGLVTVQQNALGGIVEKFDKIRGVIEGSGTRATVGRVKDIGRLMRDYERAQEGIPHEPKRATFKQQRFVPKDSEDAATHLEAMAAHNEEAARHGRAAADIARKKQHPKQRLEPATAPGGD